MLGVFLAVPQSSLATLYPNPQELNMYGGLKQTDENSCGPTAVVNSFVYLVNKYPKVYSNLIPGDINNNEYLKKVAATLASQDYMNTQNGPTFNGTTPDWLIYGKQKYLDKRVPGKTKYLAQMSTAWGNDPAGWWRA